jgi:anti-sigma B factor antagonist
MLSIDTVQIDDSTAVVALRGEIDLWSAPEFKRTLCEMLAAGHKHLVIDLAGVQFMDSTGLGVLVAMDRRLASDERLALAEASAPVLRVFEVSGVATSFRIFATREGALSYLAHDYGEPHGASGPPLTADAALLLGIAGTAMPFAQSLDEQAERWLRAMRRHGEAGAVLASLGVTEAPVIRLADEPERQLLRSGDADAVDIVTDHAGHIAAARGAAKLATTDVLQAVIHVYGRTFERVLAAHGVNVEELVARLESGEPAGAESRL